MRNYGIKFSCITKAERSKKRPLEYDSKICTLWYRDLQKMGEYKIIVRLTVQHNFHVRGIG